MHRRDFFKLAGGVIVALVAPAVIVRPKVAFAVDMRGWGAHLIRTRTAEEAFDIYCGPPLMAEEMVKLYGEDLGPGFVREHRDECVIKRVEAWDHINNLTPLQWRDAGFTWRCHHRRDPGEIRPEYPEYRTCFAEYGHRHTPEHWGACGPIAPWWDENTRFWNPA